MSAWEARLADESDLRREALKAEQARAILDSPVFAEAFAALEKAYLDAMLATPINDDKSREKLFLAMRTLPAIRKNLETMLMHGSVAVKQLANIEEDRARAVQRKG